MEPKFQSTFIPKGPTLAGGGTVVGQRRRERSLLGFIASLIFAASLIVGLGVFAYGYYLKSAIASKAAELETAKAELEPETVNELIRLNDRIVSTADLIGGHTILSPLFRFLEAATLKTVRFTSLDYEMVPEGYNLTMRGEAQSYSALAQQSDVLNKSGHFSDLVFSDLNLNEKGNVTFSLTGKMDERLLSYKRILDASTVTRPVAPTIPTGTSTQATTTPRANGATTTRATSSPQIPPR